MIEIKIRDAARRLVKTRITGRKRAAMFTVRVNGVPCFQSSSRQTALAFMLAKVRVQSGVVIDLVTGEFPKGKRKPGLSASGGQDWEGL